MSAQDVNAQPATIGQRVLAYVIDAVIAFVIGLVLTAVAFFVSIAVDPANQVTTLTLLFYVTPAVVILAGLAWVLVYTAMQGRTGSLGQRIVGIRLADDADGAPIGFTRALLRNLVWALAAAILVGYFTPLLDGSGRFQGWHDRAGRAVLVRARAAQAAASVPPASATPVTAARVTAPPASASPASTPAELDDTRAAPAPVISLTWDDGTRAGVYARTLFGRNPAAEAGCAVIAVRDETMSLSKTHFEIVEQGGSAWIVDRHSTNGTVLVRDGMPTPLVAGERTVLKPGDRLEFGDRSATVGGAA